MKNFTPEAAPATPARPNFIQQMLAAAAKPQATAPVRTASGDGPAFQTEPAHGSARSAAPVATTPPARPISPAVVKAPASQAVAVTSSSNTTPSPATYYTFDELETAAEELSQRSGFRVTVVDLKKLFIIQKADSFYVLKLIDGRWDYTRLPLTRSELAVALKTDLACLPSQIPYQFAPGQPKTGREPDAMEFFSWDAPKADGTTRRKTLAEILDELCTVARGGIVYDFRLRGSYVDPIGETLNIALAPARTDIEPEFNADVDRWLNLMGGETLKKWIAFFADLRFALTILLLVGVKNAGKTLLALILAQRFGKTGPTRMADFASRFNGGFEGKPFVYADEQLPTDHNGRRVPTAMIREWVQSDSRSLERKGQERINVLGYLRFMISLHDLGDFSRGEYAISPEALSGTIDRFTHIVVGQEPAEFLKSIGGRHGDPSRGLPGTSRWIDDEIAARHFVWIERVLAPQKGWVREGRFSLSGNGADLAEKIGNEIPLSGQLLGGFTRILKGGVFDWRGSGFVVGTQGDDSGFWVQAEAIHAKWQALALDDRTRPTPAQIKQTLLILSGQTQSRVLPRAIRDLTYPTNNPKFWRIDIDRLCRFEAEHGSDVEAIVRRYNGPILGGVAGGRFSSLGQDAKIIELTDRSREENGQ